jgi:hypothetical protein
MHPLPSRRRFFLFQQASYNLFIPIASIFFLQEIEANPTVNPLHRQEESTDPIIKSNKRARGDSLIVMSPYRCENVIRTCICRVMLDTSERAFVAPRFLCGRSLTRKQSGDVDDGPSILRNVLMSDHTR